MGNIRDRLDIVTAAQAQGRFLQDITSLLSQENVHLQAVFAFEAIGTLLHVLASLVDRAITVLGSDEDVRISELMHRIGYRKNDIPAYLRKSAVHVRSFLLLTTLEACMYGAEQIADILLEMISASGC